MDDAAGEALDKGAKMLGLDYPGGPLIDKLAKTGNSGAFEFPHPATKGFSYSFSGLKTSLLYFLRDRIKEDPAFIKKNLNDICASYQKAVIEYLLSKLKKAAEKYGVKEIGIAGGVSANSYLRKRIFEEGQKRGWNTYVPDFEYCTDNAAMIAIAGHYRYLVSDFDDLDIRPLPRWEAYLKAV